jgi:predicted TIM-barrel fold metal-dependent hydrolase
VKFVVDHFGLPDPKPGLRCNGFLALSRSIEKGRSWVKVSGSDRGGAERVVEHGRDLLRTVGLDRLMWASDCPFAGYENQFSEQHTIDAVRTWLPPGPARDQVFGRNALGPYFA